MKLRYIPPLFYVLILKYRFTVI